MNVNDLYNMQASLNRVVAIELEPKVSYRISKILKKVVAELKDAEDERQKLFKQFALPDDEGKKRVPEDKIEAFTAAWQVILDEEVELGIQKCPISLLEGIKLTAREMMDLEPIIDTEDL